MINHIVRQKIIAKWESFLNHNTLNGFETLRAELTQKFVSSLARHDASSAASILVYINATIATLVRTAAKDRAIQSVIIALRETRAVLSPEEINTAEIDYQKIMRILGVSIFNYRHRYEPAQIISQNNWMAGKKLFYVTLIGILCSRVISMMCMR